MNDSLHLFLDSEVFLWLCFFIAPSGIALALIFYFAEGGAWFHLKSSGEWTSREFFKGLTIIFSVLALSQLTFGGLQVIHPIVNLKLGMALMVGVFFALFRTIWQVSKTFLGRILVGVFILALEYTYIFSIIPDLFHFLHKKDGEIVVTVSKKENFKDILMVSGRIRETPKCQPRLVIQEFTCIRRDYICSTNDFSQQVKVGSKLKLEGKVSLLAFEPKRIILMPATD